MLAPTVKLNNGMEMPMIGLGTFMMKDVRTAVKLGLRGGYRLLDASPVYLNEEKIGHTIAEKIEDGSVKREELFIINKLWNTQHDRDKVVPALKSSLASMKLDYVDLYLIHWPFAYKGNEYALLGEEDDILLEDTWQGMEECVKLGLAKSIGLSNFNENQISRILEVAEIKPVANEIECHPFLVQKSLIEFCNANQLVTIAYRCLCCTNPLPEENIFLNDVVAHIAEKNNKTKAQVVLRYLTQLGVIPIPKSEKPLRIKQNFNIWNFELSDEDMQLMDTLNTGRRTLHYLPTMAFKEYPFELDTLGIFTDK